MMDRQSSIAAKLIKAFDLHANEAAFKDWELTLSYRDLDHFARYIRGHLSGTAPIAVYGSPSALFGAAAVACVVLGRPFVHLDPALPASVLHNIISALDTRHVIVCEALAPGHDLPDESVIHLSGDQVKNSHLASPHGVQLQDPQINFADPFLIVSTSGTTGQPKCIPVKQSAASLSYDWRDSILPYEAKMNVGAYIFAVWEMFRPLRHGATVCFPSKDQLMSPRALFDFIANNSLTEMLFTPSFLTKVLEASDKSDVSHPTVSRIILNGEVVSAALMTRIRSSLPDTSIWNLYSICETHDVSMQQLTEIPVDGDPVSVGVPMPHLSAVVLDENGTECPAGKSGHLHFHGDEMLGTGYIGRPEETELRFPTKNLDGKRVRLYDTGDQGHVTKTGEVIVEGRVAHMLKLRGHSIQMRDLTTAIANTLNLSQAVPWVQPSQDQGDVLVLYYTATTAEQTENSKAWGLKGSGPERLPAALRAHLLELLPAYCVPTLLFQLNAFPINAVSGKCDFKALPSISQTPENDHIDAQFLPVQQIAADILMSPVGAIHAAQTFTSQGGDSLMGVDFLLRLEKTYGRNIGFEQAMETPLDKLHNLLTAQDSLSKPRSLPHGPGVLLTGVTGFFGSRVLKHLADTLPIDHVIYCLIRPREDDVQTRLQKVLEKTGVATNRVVPIAASLDTDLFGLNTAEYSQLCANIKTVLHCAATVNLSISAAEMTRWALAGVEPLLDFCIASGADLRFCSTTAVFPERGGPHLERPAQMFSGISGYGASKIAAEAAIQKFGVSATLLRLPSLYDLKNPNVNDVYETILTASGKLGAVPKGAIFPMLNVWSAARFLCETSAPDGQAAIYNLVPNNLVRPGHAHLTEIPFNVWLEKAPLPHQHRQFLIKNQDIIIADASFETDHARGAWHRLSSDPFDTQCAPDRLLLARFEREKVLQQ